MGDSDGKSPPALGFLTVFEHELGLTGGYLLLNLAGRPLEFHCTAPVKPSRAQQILYGPTLEPFLYGEQIGQTLVAKASLTPLAVCTDREPALAVRDHIAGPVALVLGEEGSRPAQDAAADSDTAESAAKWRVDAPHRLLAFALGRNRLAVSYTRELDRQVLLDRLEKMTTFDFAEPFGRIREAIEEAHRGRSG